MDWVHEKLIFLPKRSVKEKKLQEKVIKAGYFGNGWFQG